MIFQYLCSDLIVLVAIQEKYMTLLHTEYERVCQNCLGELEEHKVRIQTPFSFIYVQFNTVLALTLSLENNPLSR